MWEIVKRELEWQLNKTVCQVWQWTTQTHKANSSSTMRPLWGGGQQQHKTSILLKFWHKWKSFFYSNKINHVDHVARLSSYQRCFGLVMSHLHFQTKELLWGEPVLSFGPPTKTTVWKAFSVMTSKYFSLRWQRIHRPVTPMWLMIGLIKLST